MLRFIPTTFFASNHGDFGEKGTTNHPIVCMVLIIYIYVLFIRCVRSYESCTSFMFSPAAHRKNLQHAKAVLTPYHRVLMNCTCACTMGMHVYCIVCGGCRYLSAPWWCPRCEAWGLVGVMAKCVSRFVTEMESSRNKTRILECTSTLRSRVFSFKL